MAAENRKESIVGEGPLTGAVTLQGRSQGNEHLVLLPGFPARGPHWLARLEGKWMFPETLTAFSAAPTPSLQALLPRPLVFCGTYLLTFYIFTTVISILCLSAPEGQEFWSTAS